MKYLAAFLAHRVAVDDAVLLQNRKFHQICSFWVTKCSACSNKENEYAHFMFLTINNGVIEV